MKKWLGKLGSAFSTLLVFIEIIVILFVVLSKVNGSIPSLFGYQMFVIVTPSMEPNINVGDIIISKRYNGEHLELGDVVTYLSETGEIAGNLITHEVVKINGDEIVTKGIACLSEDPPITKNNILAVMHHKSTVLTVLYKAFTSTIGFICLVLIPLITIIVIEVIGMIKEIKKEGAIVDEIDTSIE